LFDRPCSLATIQPAGNRLGYVVGAPSPYVPIDARLTPDELGAMNRDLYRDVIGHVLMLLAGVAAEALWLQIDMRIYSEVIWKFPSSDLEATANLLKALWYHYTEGSGRLADNCVPRATIHGLDIVRELLIENRAALDALALELLRRETLDGRQLERLLKQHAQPPFGTAVLDPMELFE
jgi:hypothetical protein